MGYLHIPNLYRDGTVLMFKELYALEKIHGTSAHVAWNQPDLRFFAGGVSQESFDALFDREALRAKFEEHFLDDTVIVFGEAYGGKVQGMKHIYGPHLRFVAFDVKYNGRWQSVPRAEALALLMGFEFVDYAQIPAQSEAINAERDRPSVQAVRNGIVEPKPREGIVLRPLKEMHLNDGDRVIAKHKRPQYSETRTPRDIGQKLRYDSAQAVVDEWVTPMRLQHIIGRGGFDKIEHTGEIVRAMIEDVLREAQGEIEDSRPLRVAIGRRAAKLYHVYLADHYDGE